MYVWSRILGVLAVALALILPTLAQDVKKDPDKKPAVNKKKADPDAEKDGDGPAEKKKTTKKKEDVPPEEKVVYGQTLTCKLKQMDANSQKDFTLEVLMPDPMKIMQVEQWKMQQMFNMRPPIVNGRTPQALVQYQRSMAQYQMRMAQFQMQLNMKLLPANISSPKDYPVRAADEIKVRANNPPTEYDEKGNLKRYTAKELKALKGRGKLPGYPAEFDALRPGQIVQVYFAKGEKAPNPKATPKGAALKKGLKVEDAEEVDNRPKVVMIVIMQDILPGAR